MFRLFCLLLATLCAWGFDGLSGIRRSGRFSHRLLASNKIDILARDFELTEPLRQRVESKIGKVLDKLASPGIISTNLVLRVHKNDAEEVHSSTTKPLSQIAEVTVKFKGGDVFHARERTVRLSSASLHLHNSLTSTVITYTSPSAPFITRLAFMLL